MGPPETSVINFPGNDISWEREFNAFIDAIEHNAPLSGSLQDSARALEIIEEIYKTNQKGNL
jgi:predicted dehydrogenase